MNELESIDGTGQDGRVSKKDIMNYLESRKNQTSAKKAEAIAPAEIHPVHEASEPAQKQEYSSPVVFTGNVEIIEMDRMRKMIAKHMVDSKNISAHVTSFAECDVTNLVLWREKIKVEFEKREGEKITFTPLFIEAIIKCIKRYPLLNSSVDVDRIIVKKDINIGMATALPNGNLIVPVIKNADQLNLTGLTKQVNGLANAARTNKLRPDDTAGGTFTLTNVGTFGSIMGTPIINQPQVAIMAVGAIKKRPVVIETEQGDSISIRHMMYISLSYDHRIIDGSLGSTFLNAVAKELESFDSKRSI
jgi:2-oxoglutarate dehydrogenase E2 component (dihydrolipoamide succinyltransferase)